MPEDERYISDGEAGSAGEAPQVSTNFHVHMLPEVAQSCWCWSAAACSMFLLFKGLLGSLPSLSIVHECDCGGS